MARSLRILYPGAFYHVTSRGNERKDVFRNQRDREKFLEYLASATERYDAIIHVFCLLSNHYHILIETPAGNLSQIMRHINGAYTTYFNVKRKRSGHLFQGRYKSILVEADEYATELSRYIHLNPVRAGMVGLPEEYRWSSYRSYIGQSAAPEWLKMEMIHGYFDKTSKEAGKKYRIFVEEMLSVECDSPLQGAIGTAVLGSAEFVEIVTTTQLTAQKIDREVPTLRYFASHPSPEEIVRAVESVMRENEKQARQVCMHLCHKYSGEKLQELGVLFKVGVSAISEASRLLTIKMEKDKTLLATVKRIKGILKI